MRKKTPSTIVFISALLVMTINEICILESVQANPIIPQQIQTPVGTKTPTISIFSLKNSSAYAKNDVPLVFNVSIAESNNTHLISSVYYKADWEESEIYVYSLNVNAPVSEQKWITEYSCDKRLTGISEGIHSLSIHAIALGGYYEGSYYKSFYNIGSSMVTFAIDTTPPVVSSLSVENNTFDTADVLLHFKVNESASKFSYILDGQENIPISGNTTLTGLANGVHSITVYAWDLAGNTGMSENTFFTVAEPESGTSFPVLPVITVSLVLIASAGAGLVVYFKKRKH